MKKYLFSVLFVAIVIGALFFLRAPPDDKKASKNAGDNFLAEQEQKEMELLMATTKEGAGEQTAQSGNVVEVHYIGALQDGTVFDSSRARGEPFQFTLGAGQVIQGWDVGVVGMRVGEVRRLVIPPELAYGSQGIGNVIPPNSTLIFEVEMLSIKEVGLP